MTEQERPDRPNIALERAEIVILGPFNGMSEPDILGPYIGISVTIGRVPYHLRVSVGQAQEIARSLVGLLPNRDVDALRSEYTPSLLRTIAARMQMRVDAILERDVDQRVAIEGRGCGISFLFAKDIVHALEAGHDEIERLQQTVQQMRGELLVANATTKRTGEMLDRALATLRARDS